MVLNMASLSNTGNGPFGKGFIILFWFYLQFVSGLGNLDKHFKLHVTGQLTVRLISAGIDRCKVPSMQTRGRVLFIGACGDFELNCLGTRFYVETIPANIQ